MYREEVSAPGRQDLLNAINPGFRSAHLLVAPLFLCANLTAIYAPAGLANVSQVERHNVTRLGIVGLLGTLGLILLIPLPDPSGTANAGTN